jgi:hypothetical protein
MNTEEKAAAFDSLAVALTNRWHDGRWTWYNSKPSCGTETPRETQEEAVQDLVKWAESEVKRKQKKRVKYASEARNRDQGNVSDRQEAGRISLDRADESTAQGGGHSCGSEAGHRAADVPGATDAGLAS